MKLTTTLGAAGILAAALTATAGGPALAADYPDRTVQAIVPFGAGGGTDRWARVMSSVGWSARPWAATRAGGVHRRWNLDRILEARAFVELTLRLEEESGKRSIVPDASLVTDAQIAAIALAHQGEVHTTDRDFRRFPGLTCRFPLHA